MRLTFGVLTVATIMVISLTDSPAQDRSRQIGHNLADREVRGFIGLMDTNGDDKVSIDEIATHQARLFVSIDADGNGLISAEEFRSRGRLLLSLGVTTIFDMMDKDGDQHLAIAEINRPSQRWLARYDTNGDSNLDAGEISYARTGR